MTVHLALDDIVAVTGDEHLVKDAGVLESALHRPQSAMFGVESYPDVWEKAAALADSLANNHPLHDRNKRTAYEAVLLFLHFNDEPFRLPEDPDAPGEHMVAVATHRFAGIPEAAGALRTLLGR
ncbi:type II toxin-antitoxin system death-on-curing family toxin [Kitasatospora phosalacinea]|uniref:Toxin Doc n=1 Tax=Kitasatospora phosalacinea TaxID=2065 RepID=A0A9W6UNR4_9ACTN|nr:type II toxin-antitoxin system death-on-curing family toxin [Kitasatospora phosalacinea]GLW53805.1 toxin Doc [Kitasatospora phosalacinea]